MLSNLRSEERVRSDFKTFCQLNRLAREEAYEAAVGQMRIAGLSAGTIRNYIAIVAGADRSVGAYVAKKATECFQADTVSGHAADITLEQGNAIVRAAVAAAPEHAEQLWMLLATGQRRVDVHRLRPESVKLGKKSMIVKFLWTKGIRQIKHRRIVEFPLAGVTAPPSSIVKTLMSPRPPFECTSKGEK
jgi:integrase